MAKRKFSFDDRVKYHKGLLSKFIDNFRIRTANGVSLNFEKLETAEKRNPKIQYSDGFSSYVNDIERGHLMLDSDLKLESKSFQQGYAAAKKAHTKSRNIKF